MRVQGPWALLLDQDIIEKFKNNLSKVLNVFENIMEIEAFAPKANAPFPEYFLIYFISKVSKSVIMG